ncbi:MAG: hypothetical protein QGG40_00520, partial [Myxococcota bacterium]|nr:hypothetical protein [Myxococcota bacterium]
DDPDLYAALFLYDAYVPFYVGRAYGSVFVYVPGPGQWDETTFTGSLLSNISDGSSIARIDWSTTALRWLALNAYASTSFGESGELNYALEIPPLDYVEGLEDGLSIEPALLTVGGGASVRF